MLGSTGTYPKPGAPASGYLVHDAASVLLDCGPGVFAALLEHGEMPDAIVLTHRHGDHCLDVLPLFNHLRFDRPEIRRVPLMAPAGVVDRLTAFIGAGGGHDFLDVFVPDEVGPGDRREVGGARLEFGEAVHPVPALCVKVTGTGGAIVYSGDTGPGGDLIDLAAGADLLVCESTHQGVPPPDRYPYHLFACEAGEIASTAGVARLFVTHVAPTLDPAVSVDEAAAAFDGPVAHAAPGLEIEL